VPVTHEGRHVPLEAVHNFRDLGGYPTADGRTTRWRTLYRADGLHRLTAADIDALRSIGLTTVIDLRTVDELTEWGRFPLEHHPAEYHHLPILDEVWGPGEPNWAGADAGEVLLHLYLEMFRQGEQEIASVLAILAEPAAYPVVYHCAAGKDRTGIVTAVILGILGVPDEVIAADYALSEPAMDRMEAWYRRNHPDRIDQMAQAPQAFRAARPATMEALLHLVEQRHGSMRGYARSIGVSERTLDALAVNLLES